MKLADFLSHIVFGSLFTVVNFYDYEDVIYDGEKPLVWSDSFGFYDVCMITCSGNRFVVYVSK